MVEHYWINSMMSGRSPPLYCSYLVSYIQRMSTRKKLLYTVANPARGLLNREMYTPVSINSAYAIPVAYPFLNVRMLYGQHFQQSVIWYGSTGCHCQSCSRTSEKEKRTIFLSSFAPENVISRDRFRGPVPRQPAAHSPHSRLNVVLTYLVPPRTVLLLYVEQTAPAAAKSRACERENCAIHFYGFSLLLHFVLLTDAAAVFVLYCRFLKKKYEHI